VRAYVGLGSNLGDREATIRRAVELLDERQGIHVAAVSTLRETDPVGVEGQPRFLNGAAALEVDLTARGLLDELLAVERELGRDRSQEQRWGPRTIDLDLLLYGEETIEEPGLTVPHPRLAERQFVLEPLHELEPDLALPDGRAVRELVAPALE
jgi:2-amino-4-hydroxy-6-hydroxymethyldihydropteridine diphosphokinase